MYVVTAQEGNRFLKCLGIIVTYQSIIGSCFVLHFLFFPKSAMYMTSELNPVDLENFFSFAYGLVHCWFVLNVSWLLTVIFVVLLFYLIFFVPIFSLEFLLDFYVPNRKSHRELRKIDNFTRMYRSVQLLIQMQNQLTPFVFMPLQGVVMYHIVFCYVVVFHVGDKFSTTANIVLALFGTGMLLLWTAVLNLFGRMEVIGAKIQHSWRKHGQLRWKWNSKYMNKFQKSCKPILVAHGTSFEVRRFTVLNVSMKISTATFETIILTKNMF